MALTVADFRALHAEFRATSNAVVEGCLNEALGELSESVYGTKLDSAHRWLTAHKIASHPQGRPASLEDDDASMTTYLAEYQRIRRLVAPRVMVT